MNMKYQASAKELKNMFRNASGRVKLVTTGTDQEHEVLNSQGEVIHANDAPREYGITKEESEGSCENCNPCDFCSGCHISEFCDDCDDYCDDYEEDQEGNQICQDDCNYSCHDFCNSHEYICSNGCPRCDDCEEDYLSAPVGLDGNTSTAEVRQEPGFSPSNAVDNLRNVYKTIPQAIMSTVGDRFALGGHIHLGFKDKNGCNISCRPSSQYLRILDYFIGRPSQVMNGKGRGSYAQLSAWESKYYGFEYRSAPAAIFHNPHISLIFFKIAWYVTKKYLRKIPFELSANIEEGMASDGEYIEYANLSERQVRYLRNFIKNFHKIGYTENAVANWNRRAVKLAIKKANLPKFKYSFNDDWSTESRQLVENSLNGIRTPKRNVRILLFGMANSRGDVTYGFDVRNYHNMYGEHTPNIDNNSFDIVIGMPASFRTGYISDENKSAIMKSLISTVRQKLKEM